MTREETAKILSIINATWTNFKPENPLETLDAWSFFLADYQYNQIAIALKSFVATNGKGFAPSVDQLIAYVHKVDEFQQPDEGEAWSLVFKALQNSAYNSRQEFEKLPELVQKAVGSPNQLKEWALDPDFNHGVESSNFKKNFRRLADRQLELSRLPIELTAQIQERGLLNG